MYTIEIEILIVFIVIAVAAVISGISVVYKHIKGLRNDMKAFDGKTSDIQSEFQEIMDILENKDFSKDWSEYLKWKETKEYIPDLEEMVHIKDLKRLIQEYDLLLLKADELVWTVLSKRVEGANHSYNWRIADRYYKVANSLQQAHAIILKKAKNTKQTINAILKEIKNKKELVGVLKLYGVSSKWIQP